MSEYYINHLRELESEAIFIIRDVAAQFDRPVLLFSGGKDSIVMAHIAKKAFFPAHIPFPLMHVDTGHNFTETIEFRDRFIASLPAKLIVASVQQSIDKGRVKEETGYFASRNLLQTTTLLDAIEEHKFDAAMGGGRRDEEKARAKERIFSHRDAFGQWDPKNQRPELWNIFNGRKLFGEHFRVFPLSNWTELDVWQYIGLEQIEIPSIYYSHEREVIEHDGMFLAYTEHLNIPDDIPVKTMRVRCRTVGDMTCTGLVLSEANKIQDIIDEVAVARVTERGGRADDKRSETAMEDRKKEGYF